MAAYLELHIEQGPVLEAGGGAVGVVTGVQGICWLDIRIRGTEAHAGAFPMSQRDDALVAAAKVVLATETVALKHRPGVATVGYIHASPNSRNVVPGEVHLEIDIRHPDESGLASMQVELTEEIVRLAPAAEVSIVWRNAPVHFDSSLRGVIRQEAKELSLPALDTVSGAGHDAAHLASKVPTAMIFIPSRDGLSHNEREYSSPQQCADGANLLLRSVLRADELFHG
jgi:N-carbamoyl-L-amino-acid hydrolase